LRRPDALALVAVCAPYRGSCRPRYRRLRSLPGVRLSGVRSAALITAVMTLAIPITDAWPPAILAALVPIVPLDLTEMADVRVAEVVAQIPVVRRDVRRIAVRHGIPGGPIPAGHRVDGRRLHVYPLLRVVIHALL
jgi:hypothetical protein